ncbi:MAG: putative toxin-antitoxin system toxin component, PIN family [bacterium]
MKVVLDTNTLVSAIGWEGPPNDILISLREGRHQLVTTPDLLDELTRVLRYPRLRSIAIHPALPEILAWIHRPAHIVYPTERVTVMAAYPEDNIVSEAALGGAAEAIVSGDRHPLKLGIFRNVPILTARRFVDLHLGKQGPP